MPGMSSISASAGQNTGRSCFRKATVTGSTVLAFFPDDTGHFGLSGQRAMLNFRVDDLDGLLDAMAAAGVRSTPSGTPTTTTANSAGSPIPRGTAWSFGSRSAPALENGSAPESGA